MNGRNESAYAGTRSSPTALVDENRLSQSKEILAREIASLLKQEIERCESDDSTQSVDSLLNEMGILDHVLDRGTISTPRAI